MRALIALFFSVSLCLVAGQLQVMMVVGIVLIVASSFILGRIVGSALGVDEPFAEFTLGFTLLSYVILVALRLMPLHISSLLLVLLAFIAAYVAYRIVSRNILQPLTLCSRGYLAVGALAAVLAALWSRDNFSRLEIFDLTGRLDFWVDIFVHAARVAEIGGSLAAGRGNALLADFPTPLYHIASYAPSALVLAVTDTTPLSIATLIWIPMGVLVMITGILSLGYALGGQRLAVWVIPALALVPAMDGFPLYNGFFSFPWLLEAGPGALYGLGASCTALAFLVLWMQGGRWPLLAAAVAMTGATFLIRANFFVWLAPLVGLASIHDSRRFLSKTFGLSPRSLTFLALVTLISGLIALSWLKLAEGAQEFLVSYLRFANMSNAPTAYDGLFTPLDGQASQFVALMLSLPLIFFAIQGVWLPIFFVLRHKVRSIGLGRPWHTIPVLLLIIVTVFTYLGPMPPNGDISEFRHRAAPLLLVVTMVWTIHFASLALQPRVDAPTVNRARHNWALGLGTIASLAILSLTVSQAKAPRMDWGQDVYGQMFVPDLARVAKVLSERTHRQSRFVVAGASPDARILDDAAVIVALSGVPAFMSCPQSILMRNDRYGDDARRRAIIQSAMDNAISLKELHELMSIHSITQYIVLDSSHALFDPDRSDANWSFGGSAIYETAKR